MNRYKTVPGLGPPKAGTTTTCQKCLQKGHYSYECKASLQSRPYVSRASRTQQLRNPKLKPALTETKLNEAGVEDTTKSSDESHQQHLPDEAPIEPQRGRSRSSSLDRPSKRQRRSVSSSSQNSVSTISTASSRSDEHTRQPSSRRPRRRVARRPIIRSPSNESTHSPSHRSPSPPQVVQSRSRRRSDHLPNRDEDIANDQRSHGRNSRALKASDSVRHQIHRSRSPERVPRSRPSRQRSLSPYSRRLALTQAMNAER